jgi:hypothetical protein
VEEQAAPFAWDTEPAGCQSSGEATIQVAGAKQHVALVTCHTGDHTEDDGVLTHDYVAQLVLTLEGSMAKRRTIGDWNDGDSWGSTISLVGVLEAPSGDGALVLHKRSHADGAHEAEVGLYRFHSDWNEDEAITGTVITPTLSPDRRTLSVDICTVTDPATQDCESGSAPHVRNELSYDGKTFTRR